MLKHRKSAVKNAKRLKGDTYGTSRNLFIMEIVAASVMGDLSGGFFLSGYFAHIGMSQSMNGIIAALPMVTTIFQPVGALVASRSGNLKSNVVVFALIQRFSYSILYAIPLILSRSAWIPFTVAVFLAGSITSALITPLSTDWLMQITPREIRAAYFSKREMVLVGTGALISLLMGLIMNFFSISGQFEKSYTYLVAGMSFFAVINVICLISIKKPPKSEIVFSGIKELLLPLKDKTFRRVIILVCVYIFGVRFATPFWSVYQISNLRLSYRYLTILMVASSLGRVIFLRLWFNLKGETRWSSLTVLSLVSIASSHFLNAFITAENALWLLPASTLFGLPGWACVGMAVLNFEYDNIAGDSALSIGMLSVVTGTSGFTATLLGGALLSGIEASAPVMFGRMISGQQIQMLISAVIISAAAILIFRLGKRAKIV